MANLVGQFLPDVTLPCTILPPVELNKLAGLIVVFIYPWTGKPDHPNPESWDNIPGAHGSTPQCRAYSNCYDEFCALGVKCFGLSQLNLEWQKDFAQRNNLVVPLLSDEAGSFARGLDLQYIVTGNKSYLKRRTLIALDQKIILDRTDVSPPEADADFILAHLKTNGLLKTQRISFLLGQRDLIRRVAPPSPPKVEKVDRAQPETDEVPLVTNDSRDKANTTSSQSLLDAKLPESNPT